MELNVEVFVYYITRKGSPQARVSMDIFHDGLRRETCSDTRITLAQYPIILAVHSVHFANFLRGFTLLNDSKCPFSKLFKGYLRCKMILNF